MRKNKVEGDANCSTLAVNHDIDGILEEKICIEKHEIDDQQLLNLKVEYEDDILLSVRHHKKRKETRTKKIIQNRKNERQKQLEVRRERTRPSISRLAKNRSKGSLDEKICTEEQEIDCKQVVNSEVDSEDDIPLSIRLHKRKTKRKRRNKKIIPQIPKDKLKDFKSSLKCANQKNERQKQLQECIERMRSRSGQHWNSPCTILKAINHALCNRKWNNVTSLLLMLIRHGGNKYIYYIHHICEIMEKANPLLKNSGLQWQFETVRKLYALQTKDA